MNILPEYYGWFRPYPLLLFIGFVSSCLLVFIKAKKKNLPLVPFEKYIFIALPVSLLFASFFGKLDYKHPLPIYELFFIWQPGLSIHGAILGGLVSGLLFFPSQSKKYKISMWVWLDIIGPSILLGQIIGRWGNFFNHEILGNPVSKETLMKFLPHWIWDACYRFDINSKSKLAPQTDASGQIIYRQPLFLYEIIGLSILFIFLNFIVPNLGKWFGKKPWKDKKNNLDFSKFTWKGKWNQIYYETTIDEEKAIFLSNDYKHIKINPKLPKKQKLKLTIIDKKKYWQHTIKKSSYKLTKLHNKNNITVIRSGLVGSLFFLGYNFIRIFIETQRQPQEMFIKNAPPISYALIIIFTILGLISAIFAQFISPYKWRLSKWYYEKQY